MAAQTMRPARLDRTYAVLGPGWFGTLFLITV